MKNSDTESKHAIVLFSGGIDSTTCLALAIQRGYQCHTLSFDYGQRHCYELHAAKQIAAQYQAIHHVVKLNNLADCKLTNPHAKLAEYTQQSSIPDTYVPARNTIFLSVALGWAETLNAQHIYFGANADDYNSYMDCRPEYFQAYQSMANLATKAGIKGQHISIETPLLQLNKTQIIQLATSLGVKLSATITCYEVNENGQACGCCESCMIRRQGFTQANISDPTCYIE